mgnify:CR=1 FL=1
MSFMERIWIRELLKPVLSEEELDEEMKRINEMDDEEFSEYVKALSSGPSKEAVHADICQALHETYKAKNADYGDSFALVRKKYPNAILIRLNDKLNRLDTLLQSSEQHVHDESIDDTLLDLANYCIMELVERKSND